MSTENLASAKAFYAAIHSGDFEALFALLACAD